MLPELRVDVLNNQVDRNIIISTSRNDYVSVLLRWQYELLETGLNEPLILQIKEKNFLILKSDQYLWKKHFIQFSERRRLESSPNLSEHTLDVPSSLDRVPLNPPSKSNIRICTGERVTMVNRQDKASNHFQKSLHPRRNNDDTEEKGKLNLCQRISSCSWGHGLEDHEGQECPLIWWHRRDSPSFHNSWR